MSTVKGRLAVDGYRDVAQRLEGRRDARPASDLAVTLLSGVAIALPLIFYLHQHVELLRSGYEIEALQARRTVLLDQQREWEARRATAASPERAELAASALGLVAPQPDHVRVAEPVTAPGRRGDGDVPTATPVVRSARLE